MALIPKQGNPHGELKTEEVKSPAIIQDEGALKLVVQDAATADSFLSQKQWPLRWREIDVLYQSPRPISQWEGTQVQEANVTSFTIAKHVNAIVPQCVNGLFYDDPPFILRPRPGTTQDVIRAKSAVFTYQLDAMNFEEQVEDGIFYTALFGTAIYKWGWITGTKKENRYVRKQNVPKVPSAIGGQNLTLQPVDDEDEFEVKEIEKKTDRPHFEHVDLRHVLVDPACRVPDIRKAKWVIHRMYLTYKDLARLRDVEGWDIPDDATLRSYFETPKEDAVLPGAAETRSTGTATVPHAAPRYDTTTADPLDKPLKVEERWDKDKVIAVLQDKLVIRNEANPFGCIPFYSSHWWRIPDSFYSLGIGHLVGQDQRVQQGLRNAALNLLGLAVNPNYLRARGANVPTQQIRQRRGGIIDVDGDIDKAFRILEIPRVPQEVWAALQNSQAESESTSAADSLLVQGSTQPGTSMGRTAGGASILGAASASRLQNPMTRFIANVFKPWIYQMDELDRERLPLSVLRDILGDELGDEFSVDEDEFLNAKIDYEILAGAHLSAKKGMAQALPLISQIFENQQLLAQLQQIGYTVDVKELFEMFMEISEWKNSRDIIRPLNDQEKQFMAANNPAVAKVKMQEAMQDKKFEQEKEILDQKNEARATDQVLRQVLQKSMSSMAIEGEPGESGFGSEQ